MEVAGASAVSDPPHPPATRARARRRADVVQRRKRLGRCMRIPRRLGTVDKLTAPRGMRQVGDTPCGRTYGPPGLGVMRFPRFMRAVLDPVTERIPVPILGGLNRGRLWSLASSGSGYGTGRRAHEQMALLRSLLAPGHVFWDVGAHHGYVTLMASAAVGGGGAVHAFEPGSRNGRMLRRHLSWTGSTTPRLTPSPSGRSRARRASVGATPRRCRLWGRGRSASPCVPGRPW